MGCLCIHKQPHQRQLHKSCFQRLIKAEKAWYPAMVFLLMLVLLTKGRSLGDLKVSLRLHY